MGSVYVLTPDGVGEFTFSTLASFSGGIDGAYANSWVVEASDGNFYGTTQYGGEHGVGTVFRVDGAGQLTVIHSFAGPDGEEPVSGLVEGPGGVLYGTTFRGGANGSATAFRLDLSGAGFAVLHDFTWAEGLPEIRGRSSARTGCSTARRSSAPSSR